MADLNLDGCDIGEVRFLIKNIQSAFFYICRFSFDALKWPSMLPASPSLATDSMLVSFPVAHQI